MNPPREFVSALRAFDKELRIRWATRTCVWFIERKLPERHRQLLSERPNPWKSPRGFDLYDGWREGWVHILSVHPDLLDHRVFDVLAAADSYRQGGFAAINRQLDEAVEQWERDTDRAIQNFQESAAREAFDDLQSISKQKIFVPVAVTNEGEPG